MLQSTSRRGLGAIVALAALCACLATPSRAQQTTPPNPPTNEQQKAKKPTGAPAKEEAKPKKPGELPPRERAEHHDVQKSPARQANEGHGSIQVVEGTYGGNCGVRSGNVTSDLARACNGKASCDYQVSTARLSDPKYGCAKAYVAQWRCAAGGMRSARLNAEANGQVAHLSCDR